MEAQSIAEVLGGRKVLGKTVRKSDDLVRLVRDGLPADSMRALAERLSVGNAVLARMLGIPPRTMSRRLSGQAPLTVAESDRAMRLARVIAHAMEMIGDNAKAVTWLSTPNRALGGERPVDQLDTDLGALEVDAVLGRIAYGVYS